MKRAIIFAATILITTCAATSVFADLKVRTRQTMGGQSFENTSYIKGKRQRSETMNGAMVNITQCDLKRAIQLNPASRTFVVNEFGDIEPASSNNNTTAATATSQPVARGGRVVTTINIKDTGERKQMFGFQARRLIITMETESSPEACNKTQTRMETDGWYIDFAEGFDCGQAAFTAGTRNSANVGCQDKYEYKQTGSGRRGFAVYEKITVFDKAGRETMSMTSEVIELSKATLDSALFEVPEGYRQVTDASQMYSTAASSTTTSSSSTGPIVSSNSSMPLPNTTDGQSLSGTLSVADSNTVSGKKAGVIRIGLAHVKTGSVGQGITAADLAMAVQNTLIEYLKMPNLEVVPIEARLPVAIENEAKEKDCDFVVSLTVNHKKGGGGGGMFGSALGSAIARTGIGHTGSTVGNIAGQMATQAIISATSVSSQMKAKDEITLDLKLHRPAAPVVLTKQYKAKAKSDGDDIISVVIEQAAQAIVDAMGE